MDFVTYSGLILSLKKYIHKTKIQSSVIMNWFINILYYS